MRCHANEPDRHGGPLLRHYRRGRHPLPAIANFTCMIADWYEKVMLESGAHFPISDSVDEERCFTVCKEIRSLLALQSCRDFLSRTVLTGHFHVLYVAQVLLFLGQRGCTHPRFVAKIRPTNVKYEEGRLEKCWEIRGCQKKETCRAFPHFGRSCWLIKGKLSPLFGGNGETNYDLHCDSCEVYQWQTALSGGRSSKHSK